MTEAISRWRQFDHIPASFIALSIIHNYQISLSGEFDVSSVLPEDLPIRYNERMIRKTIYVILSGILIAGCTSLTGSSTETPPKLTPYVTRTAFVPTLPPAYPTLEPPPVSTRPTQITHVVSKGEDMGGIATKYGVKIKDLREANAEIDPRMMPIGTVLIIPSGDPEQDAFRPTNIPTPVTIIQTGTPVCYGDASGGAWCLVMVFNNSNSSVEDISVDFILSGSDGNPPEIKAAFSLLDRLTTGQSAVLAAYFKKAPGMPWKIDMRLRTASPSVDEGARYLQSTFDRSTITLAEDRLSARVTGVVNLIAGQSDANIIQVTAAAYNAAGQPVGVRRWESPVGLESGSGLVCDFVVYSLGGPIDRVDVLLETRP